jgi:solute carrier family 25 (mitochondrial carnitine/acylcarnitine transporter), member 20/29
MSADKADSMQTVKELLAGSFGGIVQVLVGQPFDTVKVRLQTSAAYSGVLDCASKTLRNEGLNGFYKGTLTPLLGIGACVSIQFAALESIKRAFGADKKPLTLGQLYIAGAGSGLANSFLAGPIEHVRIRLQVQSADNKIFNGPLGNIFLLQTSSRKCTLSTGSPASTKDRE